VIKRGQILAIFVMYKTPLAAPIWNCTSNGVIQENCPAPKTPVRKRQQALPSNCSVRNASGKLE